MAQDGSSDGSTSICVQPDFAPIKYHWFQTAPGRLLIVEVGELVAQLSLSEDDGDRLIGEFTARLLALERGQLRPIHHIKGPMDTVPSLDIYELRIGIDVGEDDRVELRIYHVEPVKLRWRWGSTVVGLHVHNKDLSDPATVAALQDAEIQVAYERFFDGQGSKWGGASVPLPPLGV